MPRERELLANGRAVLSALLQGKLFIKDSAEALPLDTLLELQRCGQLPHGTFRYERLESETLVYRHPFTCSLVKEVPKWARASTPVEPTLFWP